MKEILSGNGFMRRFSRLARGVFGQCDFGEGVLDSGTKRIIFIDPIRNRRPQDLLDSIIHEEVHAVYPEFPAFDSTPNLMRTSNEREIDALTQAVLKNLTQEQRVRYFTLYGKKDKKKRKK
jgi:hypothetical protein